MPSSLSASVEEANGLLAVGLAVRREMRQGAERQVVGGEAFRPLAAGKRDLGHVDRGADGAGDPLGDVILEVEEVVDDAVVAVGPEMRAGNGVDELRRDADAVAGLAHAPFEHVAHAEGAGDLADVDRRGPCRHRRSCAR